MPSERADASPREPAHAQQPSVGEGVRGGPERSEPTVTHWLRSYGLLLHWQALSFRATLPFVEVSQVFVGVGTVLGSRVLLPGGGRRHRLNDHDRRLHPRPDYGRAVSIP